ncbi:MAG: DNA-3-methyladenine glycosylase I [Leptolyngbyaceae cyanobacterium]
MLPCRCSWVHDDPVEQAYHDSEWGVPLHDDRRLFEFLILEGFQAGLSWITILRKRENFRTAFDGFDPEIVASYSSVKQEALMTDTGIVRNRRKIEATTRNARVFLAIQREFGSFDAYLWHWVEGIPIQNSWPTLAAVPARTELSDAISQDLKQRGFTFMGSVICYAFMQAVGMVNDHTTDCFRHAELNRLTSL